MGKFEIYKGNGGQYRWRFKAANGEIVAQGEAYTTKQACQKGIEVVKQNAPGAKIVDLT